MAELDVAIVGAGVSGLAAAYELHRRGLSVRLVERRERPGGVILTEHAHHFVVDAGPDSLLVQKPAAVDLCRELGLAERLLPTSQPRTAFIYRAGVLHAISDVSVLGFPTRLWPLATSSLFSPGAKVRMAREVLCRPRASAEDESIASFVGRHFGREAVEYIAEPLLAGIHAGDVDRLSIRATFPRLVEAEASRGSIIRTFAGRGGPEAGFKSLPGGMGELVDALVARLPDRAIRYGAAAARVELGAGAGASVVLDGGERVAARAVILATPAWSAAPLVERLDTDLARRCATIRYWSTAIVALAYTRSAVRHPLQGTGFVVPRREGLTITAGSWVSSKWPHRAPEGQVLLRAFLGGARDPDAVGRSDADLVGAAAGDLGAILSIRGEPTLTRVYRWHRSSPQQEVGHLALVAEIDRSLARLPGLFLTGTGLRGVGIPDCIADARAVATAAAGQLQG